uniref:DUF4252 domain-containing protein n=1 Tax=Roseivirga sp. TaxID=1964215 RepID=UPI0040475A6C
MRKLILVLALVATTTFAFGQSKSVERFREDHEPSLKLFFYKSTLKMFANLQIALNDKVDQELPDMSSLIQHIEKVKFFMFDQEDYDPQSKMFDDLEASILKEGYESMMTARIEQATVNFMMKGSETKPEGFVMLIRSEVGFNVVDVEGYPDLTQIMKFTEFMNSNTGDLRSLKDAFR